MPTHRPVQGPEARLGQEEVQFYTGSPVEVGLLHCSGHRLRDSLAVSYTPTVGVPLPSR